MADNRPAYAFAKRASDILLCLMSLPLLLPVFAVIAVGIKCSDRGPILYRGVRTGRNGATFRIMKFRTMVLEAERKGGGTTALNDKRVLSIGYFLRRYKFDELPQVFNVLKGDMSLVGPRPELPHYTSRYTAEERAILSVRPGITDYSSIQFSSLDELVGAVNADHVFEEKILPQKNRLRLQYVETRSFWVDGKILLATISRLLGKAFR